MKIEWTLNVAYIYFFLSFHSFHFAAFTIMVDSHSSSIIALENQSQIRAIAALQIIVDFHLYLLSIKSERIKKKTCTIDAFGRVFWLMFRSDTRDATLIHEWRTKGSRRTLHEQKHRKIHHPVGDK